MASGGAKWNARHLAHVGVGGFDFNWRVSFYVISLQLIRGFMILAPLDDEVNC